MPQDFIQGPTQTPQVQQLLQPGLSQSLQPMQGVQPPQTQEDYNARKEAWKQELTGLQQNPQAMGALMQLGVSLLAGRGIHSVNDVSRYLTTQDQMALEAQKRKFDQEMKRRQVEAEEGRLEETKRAAGASEELRKQEEAGRTKRHEIPSGMHPVMQEYYRALSKQATTAEERTNMKYLHDAVQAALGEFIPTGDPKVDGEAMRRRVQLEKAYMWELAPNYGVPRERFGVVPPTASPPATPPGAPVGAEKPKAEQGPTVAERIRGQISERQATAPQPYTGGTPAPSGGGMLGGLRDLRDSAADVIAGAVSAVTQGGSGQKISMVRQMLNSGNTPPRDFVVQMVQEGSFQQLTPNEQAVLMQLYPDIAPRGSR